MKTNPDKHSDFLADSQAKILLDLIKHERVFCLDWLQYRQLAFDHGLTKSQVNKLINTLVKAEKIQIATSGGFIELKAVEP